MYFAKLVDYTASVENADDYELVNVSLIEVVNTDELSDGDRSQLQSGCEITIFFKQSMFVKSQTETTDEPLLKMMQGRIFGKIDYVKEFKDSAEITLIDYEVIFFEEYE